MQRLLLAPVLVLLVATLHAQDPAPVPATPAPAATEMVPRLEFPNSPVESVLRTYEQLTGKRLIWDNTVQGSVNLVVLTPLTKEEAIKIIEVNLILNGFSLVPGGGDIVKVVGPQRSPASVGIPLYTSPWDLPENERVVSYLFKLQHADPADLAGILQGYLVPQVWTKVLPLPNSRSILVTENTSVIRNLIRIVNEVDIPPAEVVSQFITLQRADAEDVIEKLKAIFEDTNAATTAAGRQTPGAPPPGTAPEIPAALQTSPTVEIAAGTLTEDSIIVGKIRLTADIRTNRIHVVTRPVNLPFVRDLIQEFDSDVKFGEPSTRPLNFVSAGDILSVVVEAISEPGAEKPQVEGATGAGGQRGGSQAGGGRDFQVGGGSQSGGFQVSEGLSTEPADIIPEAITVGNTKIIADKRANAIIVLGTEEAKQKVFKVIDEIDVRAPQVLLNTVIGEMTLTENQEFGIDYLYRSGQAEGTTTTNADGTTTTVNTPGGTGFAAISRTTNAPLLDATGILNAASFATSPTGLTAFVGVTDSLQVILRALESTNRFRVTSRPMVFTSNNKKAIIASGQEVAVPVSSLTALTGSATVPSVQSSIQFKTVALQLEVVPLINSNREVFLDILQKVDSISGSSTIDGNQIPTIATRYIKTSVSVPNMGTVVLGGLVTRNKEKGYTGLPLLSRLPLIGPLFRTSRDNNTRTELIILMRPQVTLDPSENVPLREREEERLVIEPDLDSTLDPTGRRPVLIDREPLRVPNAELRQ